MTDSRTVLTRLPRELPATMLGRLPIDPAAVTEAVPAASVVLVREPADGGLEAYLLHRHTRMPFAPGAVVFPGGRQDPVDADVLACAVRETEEETGVRLAREALLPWAHWTTPVHEPRRYDTWFFVASLPTSAVAADVSTETTHAEWTRPADALAAADAGRVVLLPPTRSILLELAELDGWSAVEAACRGRLIAEVLPRAVRRNGRWQLEYHTVGEVGSYGRPADTVTTAADAAAVDKGRP